MTDDGSLNWAKTELVDWVDNDGSVIEVVTRQRMRSERLRHRATYIAVVDSADRLITHQRANWKEIYPGWWDIAFGGVCGAGEEWIESATRELAEEAGISGQTLEPIGRVNYEADDGLVLGRAFLVRYDGELSFDDGEVIAIEKVSLGNLAMWMEGRQVCLDSRSCVAPLLERYAHSNRG